VSQFALKEQNVPRDLILRFHVLQVLTSPTQVVRPASLVLVVTIALSKMLTKTLAAIPLFQRLGDPTNLEFAP
jgi:hypothetical protein